MTCTTISYKWFDRNGVVAGSDVCRIQDFKERVVFFLDECKHRDYVNLFYGKIVVDFAQEVLDGCVYGELASSYEISPRDMDDLEAQVSSIKRALLDDVKSRTDCEEDVKLACDCEEKIQCGV